MTTTQIKQTQQTLHPFRPETANLGTVRTNSSHDIIYSYDDTVDNIFQVVTPCTCSTAIIDKEKRIIKITYTSGDIPKQITLQGKDSFSVRKNITVTYSTTDAPGIQKYATLYFTVTVKQRR